MFHKLPNITYLLQPEPSVPNKEGKEDTESSATVTSIESDYQADLPPLLFFRGTPVLEFLQTSSATCLEETKADRLWEWGTRPDVDIDTDAGRPVGDFAIV